mgnify:CR=1 FL=1
MSLILERAQLIDIVNGIIPQSTTIPKLIECKNKDFGACMELVMAFNRWANRFSKRTTNIKRNMRYIEGTSQTLTQNNKYQHFQTLVTMENYGRK